MEIAEIKMDSFSTVKVIHIIKAIHQDQSLHFPRISTIFFPHKALVDREEVCLFRWDLKRSDQLQCKSKTLDIMGLIPKEK